MIVVLLFSLSVTYFETLKCIQVQEYYIILVSCIFYIVALLILNTF